MPIYAKAPGINRNFWLGVYNGILITGAEVFFHVPLVLAPFLATLGAPAVIIGLLPAIRVGGWFLPQLLMASRLAHVTYKMPWYWRSSINRFIAYSIMVTVVFVFPDRPQLIMVVVFVVVSAVSLSAGISGIPFADITAKVVPHSRLGSFWAFRNIIGGLLALVSGLVLRKLLDSELEFPQNFAYVFVLGTVLSGAAYLSFCLIREPPGKAASKQAFLSLVRRIPQLLRSDVSFRRYMRVRLFALLAVMADPFYGVYAIQHLGAPGSALGLFVIFSTISSITANLLFRRPANRGQNVDILRISILLLLAASISALLMPSWHLFSLVFMFSAAGQGGMGIAAWNLLYAVAPEEERPLYVGTANSLLALPSFAPIAAGALIDLIGYNPLFLLAALLGATAISFSFRFQALRKLDILALEERAE